MEDEKPALYVNVATRMDIGSIGFVDENGDEGYDVFFGDHKDIVEKYYVQFQKVKRFKDLKMPKKWKNKDLFDLILICYFFQFFPYFYHGISI